MKIVFLLFVFLVLSPGYNNLSFIKPSRGVVLNKAHYINRGLVGYWIANEGTGTNLKDISETGNDGTLTNFALSGAASNWVGSRMGGSIHFDGSNDLVNIGTTMQSYIDYDKPSTLIFWFSFSTFSAGSTYSLMSTAVASFNGFDQVEFGIVSDKLSYTLTRYTANSTQDGWLWQSPALSLSADKLYCVAFVYDGSNASTSASLYFNAVNQNVTVVANTGAHIGSLWQAAKLASKDLWIGRRNYTTGDLPFNGVIEEVRIYNRALNQSDLQTILNYPHIDVQSTIKRY